MSTGSENEYRAAAHLLTSPLLQSAVGGAFAEAMAAALDSEAQTIEWERVFEFELMMSGGERAMVNLALALWNGQRRVGISEMLRLGDGNFLLALEAVAIRRGVHIHFVGV